MQFRTGWKSKKREVFPLLLPYCSSTMMDTALIFWILRDIRIFRRIPTVHLWLQTLRSWLLTEAKVWRRRREKTVQGLRDAPYSYFTFINKMDRDANDTFDLLDEIEKELGIATCPVNWPIGSGKKFRGVYDRNTHKVLTFSDTQKGTKEGIIEEIDIEDTRLSEVVDPDQKEQLMEEIELLDGASADFDQEQVNTGNLTPVFLGPH